jgi:hypothetical protein
VLIFAPLFSWRLLAMMASKIPVWPREILASSPIPDEDPYAIMGNDRGERTSVCPGAAQAAEYALKKVRPEIESRPGFQVQYGVAITYWLSALNYSTLGIP